MNPFFVLLVLYLSTHRIYVLLVEDKITEKYRNWLFAKYNPKTTWTYLFTCPWCLSMWAGFGLTTLYFIAPMVFLFIALGLSVSMLTGLVEERR